MQNAGVVPRAHEPHNYVACAGVGSHVPDRALITAVNYFGATELIEGLRERLARNRAAVLLISSNSAPMDTNPDYVQALLSGDEAAAAGIAATMDSHPVYSGGKQALTIWMRRNTAAYAAQGIRMNAIGPGYTRTPLSIADAACFLLSDRASFICGAMLFVDGGHDAMLRPDKF